MKQIVYLVPFLLLVSCGQSNSNEKTSTIADTITTNNILPEQQEFIQEQTVEPNNQQQESLNLTFKKATLYKLTDTISADFDGDGIVDKAFYRKEKETSGIVIIHGATLEEIRIGFGKEFAHMDEFNWIDYWGLVEDKETTETTFSDDGDVLDSKNVILQNPSIVVGADEVGGGLVTYLDGKYVWIHQTC